MAKETWQTWARNVIRVTQIEPSHPSKLRKGCLAPLTGTDVRALTAFCAVLELHQFADDQVEVERALAIVAGQMQASTRWIARELIPWLMDWSDRERLWPVIEANIRLRQENGRRLG
jgi:hypothetical protein